ncbi:7963_t:CDS:2 [Racocetra fulgida]|uniref:7963_t:CDS:1 n=1 Tax=Racocetra fulgida TaxID=60492 RepID=A0A9N8VXR9_9GLOM|nr:7963_t:CDS:2 [Racocetra fulgida]
MTSTSGSSKATPPAVMATFKETKFPDLSKVDNSKDIMKGNYGYTRDNDMTRIGRNPDDATNHDKFEGMFNILYIQQFLDRLTQETFEKPYQDEFIEKRQNFDTSNAEESDSDTSNEASSLEISLEIINPNEFENPGEQKGKGAL